MAGALRVYGSVTQAKGGAAGEVRRERAAVLRRPGRGEGWLQLSESRGDTEDLSRGVQDLLAPERITLAALRGDCWGLEQAETS